MSPKNMIHIRIGTLSSAYFILISFLAFRTSLPQGPTLFLYNLVIITSLQSLGFYRGWFFLASSIVLTVILSLSTNFSYIWNVPVFIATFLIVKSQLDRRDYYTHIIDRRIEELGENINILTDEYNRHKKEELSLEKREARYKSLGDVATTLSTTLSIDEVEKHILNHALRIVGKAEAILLFLVDTDRQELKLVASKISRDFDHVKAKKGDLLDEWVFRERQCLLVDDIKKDFRFSEDKMKGYPRSFRSLASAPLVEAKKVLGILRLEHSRPYNYTSEDLRFLDVLCDLGAASLVNAKLYQETLDLAITDGLTGLKLRRYFLDRLNEELSRSLREGLNCSFLMIDIDNFKDYNDRYGHTAGDMVLKALADVLRKKAPSLASIGRYGGEEFCICLPDTSKEKAKRIAGDIKRSISEEVIELRRVNTQITVSMGLATFPDDAKVADELIQSSDQRLYKAKRAGKNRVIWK